MIAACDTAVSLRGLPKVTFRSARGILPTYLNEP